MILLDIWNAWQDSVTLLQEKDEAVKEAAEFHAQAIEARGKIERLHKQLAQQQETINRAAEANVVLEAKLATLDPSATALRFERWKAHDDRQVRSLSEENDLLGRRILALEAWVSLNKGDRDVIYSGAGLPTVAEPRDATPEEAA